MILQSITKGNLNLELTKNTYKHENNLRFHFKIDGRFYEYTTCTINKATLNLQCVVHKKKKCNGNDGQQRHFNQYIDKAKMNNLTSAKRQRTTTERYERLAEICEAYDNLSGPERQESLIDFLGQFARTDNIPKLNDGDIFDVEIG